MGVPMDWRKGSAALSIVALASVAFGSVLGQAQSPTAGAGSAAPLPTVDVDLKGSLFSPNAVMVQVNQTVRWTNKDAFAHDVTGANGAFNSTGGSGGLQAGAAFSHSFSKPGVYDYYCTLHSSGPGNAMWGRLIVVNAPVLQLAVGGSGASEIDPEEIGVKWLAHWVGIVSFLAVIATLLIYYFVLKFGESVHTTDHRDRKEK